MVSSLEDQAYNYIKKKLFHGRLPAGSRISDAELASEMNISRTPVREAIIRFRNEGVIEQIPRRGTFVRIPSAREMLELYDLRRTLESHAVVGAARRISKVQLIELRSLHDEMLAVAREVKQKNTGVLSDELAHRMVLADVKFHLLIMHAAANRRVVKIVSDLQLMGHLCGKSWADMSKMSVLSKLAHTCLDHWRIFMALDRGDAQAARYWMRRHHPPVKDVADDIKNMVKRIKSNQMTSQWPESVRDSIRWHEEHGASQ